MVNNSTDYLLTVPSEILLPSIVFKFIAMIIGVLGNSTVIVYTILLSKDKTVTSYLVGNLALADLLVCLTFYPIWIIEFIQTILNIDHDENVFCKLSRSTIWTLLFVSNATLVAITVDRYLYIVKPLKYPQIVTRRRVALVVTGIWLTACPFFAFQVHYLKVKSGFRSLCDLSEHFYLFTDIFIGYIPLALIFIFNLKILNVARAQRKRILAET